MSTIGEKQAPSYEVSRNKEAGTVKVTIVNDAISYQKADALAQGMFVVPVRLLSKLTNRGDHNMTNVLEIRHYLAVNWN
jgi:hypothetical protein